MFYSCKRKYEIISFVAIHFFFNVLTINFPRTVHTPVIINFGDEGTHVCEICYFLRLKIDDADNDFAVFHLRENSIKKFVYADGTNVNLVGEIKTDEFHLVRVNAILHKVFLIKYLECMHPTNHASPHDSCQGLYIPFELDLKYQFDQS